MDRNSIIGYVLIFAIITGFYYYTSPTTEELALAKYTQDSLVQLKKQTELKALAQAQLQTPRTVTDSTTTTDTTTVNSELSAQFGDFAQVATLSKATYIIENQKLKATIAAKGGRVVSLQLKEYKTDKGAIIEMVDADSSNFGLSFTAQNRTITTNELNFTAAQTQVTVAGSDSSTLSVKMALDANRYIEYVYSLKGNSYLLNCSINIVGMQNLIAPAQNNLTLNWQSNMLSQENTMENQRNASTIYYNDVDEKSVDNLTERGGDSKTLTSKLKWIAFRQQFFTQTLIAATPLEGTTLLTTTVGGEGDTTHVKNCTASISLPYRHTPSETVALSFFYGPTHYSTLKSYGYDLEKQVPLGWFGFINKFLVIPVFNFLGSFNLNYGIVILLLTLFIKMILLPLTYKAYLSTAKMKVLKPEIDEINKKFPGTEDAMEKQKETMSLYRKAGVNPFGGCLPMVLQMPILFSMFRFFPASFELRQKSFLWATDLSTYDSVYNIGYNIPFYGNHVSLFTILMTVSTIIYTKMNSSNMVGQDSNPQMQSLKYMMYIMPVMFMFMFNSYASGLSYYYFIANILTFTIQYSMRFFVDEEKLHLQLQENKKKPVKASAWQQKIEELGKQKGINPPKK